MQSRSQQQVGPPTSRMRYVHAALLSFSIATSVVATFRGAAYVIRGQRLFADFTVFWTAARFPRVYDAEALTRAQQWVLGSTPDLRPFVYPPSTLLLIKPLDNLDYWPAAILWIFAGVVCFALACSLYGKSAALALLSPMAGLCVVVGQASLFLGAGLAAAVALLADRELLAGALLGVVAASKPQLATLVPVALICGRHWQAFPAAALACGAVVLASLFLGVQLWADWLRSLDTFLSEVQGENFRRMNMAAGFYFAPLGIASVALVWTRSESAEFRLLALVSGTCLTVPYMMNYDLVAMAPAAAVLLLSANWRKWITGFAGFSILPISPFIVTLATWFLIYQAGKCRD